MIKSDKKENEEIVAETEKESLVKQDDPNSKAEPETETIEDKLNHAEEKVLRLLAEMENQRRRFEKEKDEAFDYGGMVFARDALNLLDNLERSKQSINNDQNLDENSKKKT
mgnify:CR=1 FL=1